MEGTHILKLDAPAWKQAIEEYLDRRMIGKVTVEKFEGLDVDLSEAEIYFQLQSPLDRAKPLEDGGVGRELRRDVSGQKVTGVVEIA